MQWPRECTGKLKSIPNTMIDLSSCCQVLFESDYRQLLSTLIIMYWNSMYLASYIGYALSELVFPLRHLKCCCTMIWVLKVELQQTDDLFDLISWLFVFLQFSKQFPSSTSQIICKQKIYLNIKTCGTLSYFVHLIKSKSFEKEKKKMHV